MSNPEYILLRTKCRCERILPVNHETRDIIHLPLPNRLRVNLLAEMNFEPKETLISSRCFRDSHMRSYLGMRIFEEEDE